MNGQRSAPDGKSKVTLSLPQGKTPCPATRELGRQFERALGTQGAYAVVSPSTCWQTEPWNTPCASHHVAPWARHQWRATVASFKRYIERTESATSP